MDFKKIFIQWPFRRKLLLLLLIIFLPALGIIVTTGISQRQHAIVRAREDVLLLVRSLVAQQEQIAVATKTMLSTLARLPQVQSLDASACNRIFAELHQLYPFYASILAMTPDGYVFAAHTPLEPGKVNQSDRKYFQDAISSRDFSVGEYIIGRVSKTISLNYSFPVLNVNKKLVAVLTAGLNLHKFSNFISLANLPAGSAVVFLDHKGLRLYRSPEHEATPIGQPPPQSFLDLISGNNKDGLFEWKAMDGINRIWAYKQLRLDKNLLPYLYIAVGQPKDPIIHKANLHMLGNLSILGFAALLALSLAWILANVVFIKPINRLVAATQQFGQGDMDTRTGLPHTPDELGRLARSFDDMASLLETKNFERDRAEGALNKAHAELEGRVQERTAELTASTQRLEYSRNMLQLIIESVPVRVFWKDSDLRYLGCNTLFARDAGFPHPQQLLGKDDFAMGWRDQADLYRTDDRQVMESSRPKINIIEPLTTPTGATIWLNTSKVPLQMPNGEVFGVLGIYEDITYRKQAEEALLQSEEKFRLVFEKAPLGIMHYDQMSNITDCNEKFAEIIGASKDHFISFNMMRQLSDDKMLEAVAASLKGEVGYYEGDYLSITAGKITPVRAIFQPLFSSDGVLSGGVTIFEDVSERKRAESERLQFSKLESLSILAGGIAHDFNNILTAILGNIGLAMLNRTIGEEEKESLVQAEKACLRAQELSGQLLTFAKGGAPIKKVNSLVKLVRESGKLALAGSKSSCVFSIPEDLWSVEADAGQIHQVINNLLINADQAMPSGGIIKVEEENVIVEEGSDLPLSEGKYVKLTITDRGVGIPNEYVDKIFDPYFTTKHKGSGLGLATAYSIIKNHSGHIKVESQFGVGTTVEVFLPAIEAETLGAHEEPLTVIIGQGRILVMDDDEKIREVLGRMLPRLGYEVDSASDGSQAIERFVETKESGRPFDVVILDLTVPGGMGGQETLENLLRIDPHVKAIVSSGYSDDPIMANFKESGFSEVIAKPYRVVELSKILGRIISKQGN